jgi:hypothetical protein
MLPLSVSATESSWCFQLTCSFDLSQYASYRTSGESASVAAVNRCLLCRVCGVERCGELARSDRDLHPSNGLWDSAGASRVPAFSCSDTVFCCFWCRRSTWCCVCSSSDARNAWHSSAACYWTNGPLNHRDLRQLCEAMHAQIRIDVPCISTEQWSDRRRAAIGHTVTSRVTRLRANSLCVRLDRIRNLTEYDVNTDGRAMCARA